MPTEIVRGDVIEDPSGARWVTVREIQMLDEKGPGAFSFFGAGPDDRVTFEGDQPVRRLVS